MNIRFPGLESELSRSDSALQADIASWRSAGRALIATQSDEFRDLTAAIEPLIDRRRYSAAAAAAQVAANYAVMWHPGTFASPSLERALRRLGKAAIRAPNVAHRPRGSELRVLHVATSVGAIGGHVRMLRRWIAQDSANIHSVALSRQTEAVPDVLRAAVATAGGRITLVNRLPGGLLSWARSLQACVGEADLVVLHVHNQDIVAFLALAGMTRRPPVILLNHADHVFWLGAGFVDLVVSTRRSGHGLCASRRGIAPERNALLPLSVDPVTRRSTREQAKRALGLADCDVVLLSVARAVKYRPMGGLSFADALLPLLRSDKRLRLVAVGPGGTVDWSAAEAAVPGQIVAYKETPTTAPFFEAADIYVDSFPFSSITSLIEAGLYMLPLLTRFPFGRGCEIMGADSVGIDETLVRAQNLDGFRTAIARLADDSGLRAQVGEATRAGIESTNHGTGWRRSLYDVYDQAFALSRRARVISGDDAPCFSDVDVLLPFVFGTPAPSTPTERRANARELGLKTLPPVARARAWAGMSWRREFRFRDASKAWRYLVPEWMTVRARRIAPEKPFLMSASTERLRKTRTPES